MTLEVKHSTVASTPDDGTSEVGTNEWNANHTVQITGPALIGKDSAGAGAAAEISVSTGLSLSAGALTNSDRGSSAVTAHEAAGDPHPQYLTAAEGDAAYAPAVAAVPTGGSTGQVLKKNSNTNYDYSWQADSTGAGGSPAGSTGEVQYNNGGVFAGATGFKIESNVANMPAVAAPPAPPSNSISYFTQLQAARAMPRFRAAADPNPCGVQRAFWDCKIPVVVGPAGGTTAPVVLAASVLTAATMSFAQSFVSNNRWTSQPKKRYAISTANTATGIRQNYTQFYRGSQPGYGGFFFAARVGVANNKLADLFVGMCASTAVLGGNASALTNCIGMGYDVGDSAAGNWFLIRNDGAGVATKVGLGATNAARAADIGFDLFIYNPPNSGEFYVQIINVNTGAEVLNTSYNTDVPAADTGLAWKCEVRNDANATQCSIEHNFIYVEPLS